MALTVPMALQVDENSEEARAVSARAAELMNIHQMAIWKRTDRLFAGLLAFEWVGGILLAFWRTPWTWEGASRSVHPHVWQAVLLGTLIVVLPIMLCMLQAGKVLTRQVVAASQMLISALLIHLGGGRIEMHFHVFGSLAFLAFYRDWRVLITASAVVAVDHLIRNFYLPESVYNISNPSQWRWLEHAAWVIFEDVFLTASCLQGVSEMRGIARQRALLEHSHEVVEKKVRERTEQLREAQNDLVKVARSAGMAEIATSVLHNVGNVLNSLNVSLRVATTKVQQSPVHDLTRAVALITEHKPELGAYLTQDERGKQIPAFLEAVSNVLSAQQGQVLEEMKSLAKNVEHIKQIVNVQQSHAKPSEITTDIRLDEVIEDAIRVALPASGSTQVPVVREFSLVPEVATDKHMVLQIVINLLSNAKHAVMGAREAGKAAAAQELIVRTSKMSRGGAEWVRVEVIDSGVGIEPAHLTRIFNHGFTTKKDGHGFGLHASANAAKNLGGSLSARSEGPGKGATFTLELPVRKVLVSV